eukprot:CAMPEP_0172448540 /NCGR_PEP_ID=MMETSP1065-20121228/7544_1 /TAXON_ID=265537 /ORGANISM="Amphiprora paludosa, Strain CCMP125" /LENGTH=120 /DNA_ID=CAMNT_0013200081 /DNA_START=75 /DNA_END=437 /DNA_ORIENTATION=+
MAQGSAKLGKAIKSKGAQKRKAVRKKTLNKGRKQFQAKGAKAANLRHKIEVDATKEINKRNESVIAAKAVSSGTNFFLKTLSEKGSKEAKKQLSERNKKQEKQKSSKQSGRLEDQLKKIT